MKYRQYKTTTGQTIISPVDLTYAATLSMQVNPEKIRPNDFSQISILRDENMADIVMELMNGTPWLTPALAITSITNRDASKIKNFCIDSKGTILIRNGRSYVPVQEFAKSASKQELAIVLMQLAEQTAVCQAALAGIELEKKSQHEAV